MPTGAVQSRRLHGGSVSDSRRHGAPVVPGMFVSAKPGGRWSLKVVHDRRRPNDRKPELTIGSYRLIEPLGSGGMSSVFRAVHIETGHEVAVKVLPRYLAKNPTLLQRFLREAKSAESLEHPNIVAIYDRGVGPGPVLPRPRVRPGRRPARPGPRRAGRWPIARGRRRRSGRSPRGCSTPRGGG